MFPYDRLPPDNDEDRFLILETEDELNEVISVLFETTTRKLPQPD
jgi:hypothetical protein